MLMCLLCLCRLVLLSFMSSHSVVYKSVFPKIMAFCLCQKSFDFFYGIFSVNTLLTVFMLQNGFTVHEYANWDALIDKCNKQTKAFNISIFFGHKWNLCSQLSYIHTFSVWNWQSHLLKRSYDAFLKIIIWCIWCNRICWHALMFKKHIVFQILYIIVGPLSNASFSTKSLLPTSAVCSDWPTDPEHCDWPNTASTRRKCNAPFHNRELQLSKWM